MKFYYSTTNTIVKHKYIRAISQYCKRHIHFTNYIKNTYNDTEQVGILHKRISRLQPLDRAIVLLWLESIPYDEIGAIVGISAKNVSVRLFRIRQQLKAMHEED